MELQKEEIQVILALIDRVQLSGKEAMTVAQLQSKLSQGLQAPPQTAKEEKK